MAGKKKIVMVDDEDELCLMVKENLEKTGDFTVITTTDPVRMERLCREEKPDLIMVDIVMPEMTGPEVIRALKRQAETSKIPIIVASGNGEMIYAKQDNCWKWQPNESVYQDQPEVVREGRSPAMVSKDYGVDNFLAKPFSTMTLKAVIHETLKRKNGSIEKNF